MDKKRDYFGFFFEIFVLRMLYIPNIARAIDDKARAQQRPIAHLHALRAAHKQRRSVGGGIFRTNTTSEKSAYHFGGRSELQFNIGRDEHGNFRYGVGLSTQPSRDFQDVTVIYPLMDRLAHALATTRYPPEYELQGDLSDKRSGKFVFFGKIIRDPTPPDINDVLDTFDALIPLYERVTFGHE